MTAFIPTFRDLFPGLSGGAYVPLPVGADSFRPVSGRSVARSAVPAGAGMTAGRVRNAAPVSGRTT